MKKNIILIVCIAITLIAISVKSDIIVVDEDQGELEANNGNAWIEIDLEKDDRLNYSFNTDIIITQFYIIDIEKGDIYNKTNNIDCYSSIFIVPRNSTYCLYWIDYEKDEFNL